MTTPPPPAPAAAPAEMEPTLDEQIAYQHDIVRQCRLPSTMAMEGAILRSLESLAAVHERADNYENECRRLEAVMADARAKWIDAHHLDRIAALSQQLASAQANERRYLYIRDYNNRDACDLVAAHGGEQLDAALDSQANDTADEVKT
jgi:hypothetical protein